MSHDFPDGPDYNPEPIDGDPWDMPAKLCQWGVTPDHPNACGPNELCDACREYHLGATERPVSDSQPAA